MAMAETRKNSRDPTQLLLKMKMTLNGLGRDKQTSMIILEADKISTTISGSSATGTSQSCQLSRGQSISNRKKGQKSSNRKF